MSNWYADGLRFRCTESGNCCSGPAGYVWISPRDEKAIAHHLGLSAGKFRRRYIRLIGSLSSLVEKPSGECIFLTEGRRCSIHEVKPRQCLTYPFWGRVMASREEWEEATANCPGVGQGALYRPQEIDLLLDRETPREVLWRMIEKKRE